MAQIEHLLQGRYEIQREIGGGGQGRVFLARDRKIEGKEWAVKVIPCPTDPTQAKIVQFCWAVEARVLSLGLPGIPRIGERFERDGQLFLVMDYVDGKTLLQLQHESERLPEVRLLEWAKQLARIIRGLHEQPAPIVFADLNPKNLMVSRDGRLFALDFGASVIMGAQRPPGYHPRGTAGFVPWEQSSRLTPACDVYAFGATLYFLLTGEHLSAGIEPGDRLRSVRSDLSPLWAALLQMICVHEPSERVRAADLCQWLDGVAPSPCIGCQSLNQKGARFCARCGAQMHAGFRPPAVAQPTPVRVQHSASDPLPPTVYRIESPGESAVLGRALRLEFGDVAWVELHALAEGISQVNGFEDLLSQSHIRVTPYPHQLDVARRVLREMRGNAILADEVGLGKTVEAGIILTELRLRGLINRVLIVVPSHLVTQWREEMTQKFLVDLLPYRPGHSRQSPWLICDYDELVSDGATFTGADHDLVIVDEAHRLVDEAAQPTAAYQVLDAISRRYMLLLSATPVRRHMVELYYLANLLRPGQFPDRNQFIRQFSDPADPRRARNKEKLAGFTKEVMTRTQRRNTSMRWPEKRVETIRVTPSYEERMVFDQVFTGLWNHRRDWGDSVKRWLIALESNIRSVPDRAMKNLRVAMPGLWWLAETFQCAKTRYVQAVLDRVPDRVLIFTGHPRTMDLLSAFLETRGRPLVRFQGSTAERTAAVERFTRTPGAVMIANDEASEGLNLQACNVLVNYDIPWNPTTLEQRIGRVYRLEQEAPDVQIYNLVYQHSYEEAILGLYSGQMRMFELVIGEVDMVLDELADGETFDNHVWRLWVNSGSPESFRASLVLLGDHLAKARSRYELRKSNEDELDAIFGLRGTAGG